jgi:hypothetical protein
LRRRRRLRHRRRSDKSHKCPAPMRATATIAFLVFVGARLPDHGDLKTKRRWFNGKRLAYTLQLIVGYAQLLGSAENVRDGRARERCFP